MARKLVKGMLVNKRNKQPRPTVSDETYIRIMTRFGESGFTLDEFMAEAEGVIPTKRGGVYCRLSGLCRKEHGNSRMGIPMRYFSPFKSVEEWEESKRRLALELDQRHHIWGAISILERVKRDKAGSICWDDLAPAYMRLVECCRVLCP